MTHWAFLRRYEYVDYEVKVLSVDESDTKKENVLVTFIGSDAGIYLQNSPLSVIVIVLRFLRTFRSDKESLQI